MTFYERYETACLDKSIEPCSQKTADLFGTTRANISAWKRNGNTPSGATVANIANKLHVSTDYLLGRTEDPTDYTITARLAKAITTNEPTISNEELKIQKLIQDIQKLDDTDSAKAIGFISGLLANEKYR